MLTHSVQDTGGLGADVSIFRFSSCFLQFFGREPVLEASCAPHIMHVFPSYSALLFPAMVSLAMTISRVFSGKLMLQGTESLVKTPQPAGMQGPQRAEQEAWRGRFHSVPSAPVA